MVNWYLLNYWPQWEGNVFTSVCLFTWGDRVFLVLGPFWRKVQYLWSHVLSEGIGYPGVGYLGVGYPEGGRVYPTLPYRLKWRPLLRLVSILLECFLVSIQYDRHFCVIVSIKVINKIFLFESLKLELHVNYVIFYISIWHGNSIKFIWISLRQRSTLCHSCVIRSYYLVWGYVLCVNGTLSLIHSLNDYWQTFSRNISFGRENDPKLWLAFSTKGKGRDIDIMVWPKGITIRNDSKSSYFVKSRSTAPQPRYVQNIKVHTNARGILSQTSHQRCTYFVTIP